MNLRTCGRQAKKPKSATVPKARVVPKAKRGVQGYLQRYLPRNLNHQACPVQFYRPMSLMAGFDIRAST